MLCTAATKVVTLAQIFVTIAAVTYARHVNGLNVVQNSYIVTLNSGIYSGRAYSVHAEFYRDLRSRGVSWTTLKEYRDPLFLGVVVELANDTDLVRLSDAVGAEFVRPVHVSDIPVTKASDTPDVSKRSLSSGVPWSHVLTGVDKVHAAGFHGEGITIGLVDSGIDYTHSALGRGFGKGHKVVGGYDFIGHTPGNTGLYSPKRSPNPLDKCNGHGTRVAGVLGANPDPERGVVGVAYGASINAYRATSCLGHTREDVVIEALLRADKDVNDIIVTAVKFSKEWSKTTASAVMDRIADYGRIVIPSVGNHGQNGPWSTDRIVRHQNVFSTGHAGQSEKLAKPGLAGVYMHEQSAVGPTSDMRLGATLAAPGDQVPTIDLNNNYLSNFGSSMAAPFMAGSMALWLQVKGKNAEHILAARSGFQNTALPMAIRGTDMIDTVARQGAGLVQVYEALRSTSRMLPSELLLNDTTYARLSWMVEIHNLGQTSIVYTMTHLPSSTMETASECLLISPLPAGLPPHFLSRTATINFSPSQLTVVAGTKQTVRVTVRPPIELDASRFPVYSGYIMAEGSDGSTLRSVYLGLAASMKQMKILDTRWTYMPTKSGPRSDDHSTKNPFVYTMRDNDIPLLTLRFIFVPPLLRLELIKAEAYTSRLTEFYRSRRTSCLLRRWISRCVPRVSSGGGSNSRRLPEIKVVGLIEERWDGGFIRWGWQRPSYVDIKVTRFADGSAIPDGRYRLLLRVLKRYGDPKDTKDYETWTGPEFVVRR